MADTGLPLSLTYLEPDQGEADIVFNGNMDALNGAYGGVTSIALLKANNLSDLISVPTARNNLGLGTMATQNATAVAITGGTAVGLGSSAIGGSTFGTSAANVLALSTGTAPTTSPADTVQLWEADRAATAGKGSLHLRTEDGSSHVLGDRVGLGTALPEASLHFVALDSAITATYFDRAFDDAGSASLSYRKSRGTAQTPTNILDGDFAGGFNFYGYFSGAYRYGGSLNGVVDGTPAGTSVPFKYVFVNYTPAGAYNGTAFVIRSTGNVGIGTETFGTGAVKVLALASGTAPTTSPADAVQLWSADRGATAGKASLHLRTEDGTSHVFGDLVGFGTVLTATLGAGASYQALNVKGSTLYVGQSSVQERALALVQPSYVVSTDASRTARLTLSAYDSVAAREGVRIEADGTAARIGFLGATAVVRQTLPAAATDATTTQALANALRTALINLGLAV